MSSPQRVLVIDDDPLFRRLVVSLLEAHFDVTSASEGAEGFHAALQDPPDLAVVDILMPGWDGLRTLRAFRSHPILARIPVVILTSDATRETVLAAIRAGASDYVVKTNFSRQELLHKLCVQLGCEPSPVDAPPSRRSHAKCAVETVPTAAETAVGAAQDGCDPEPSGCAEPSASADGQDDLERLMDDWD